MLVPTALPPQEGRLFLSAESMDGDKMPMKALLETASTLSKPKMINASYEVIARTTRNFFYRVHTT
jgi:hypothetical protein